MISIIVPVYNAQKTIDKCIESIQAQTYPNFELILVDDGSKDHSLEICEAYQKKDSRLVVIHQENGGVSLARNTGIQKATGDYIVFVDSDDDVEPDYLEGLYQHRKENYLTLCAFSEVEPQKTVVKGYKNQDIYEANLSEFMQLYDAKLINSPCNKLYSNALIKKNHLCFNSDYYLGEDLLFNLEYMKCFDVKGFVVVNQSLYNYRIEDVVSLSKTFHLQELEVQTHLFKEVISFINQNLKQPQLLMSAKESYYYALLYRLDGMYKRQKSKEVCQLAKHYLKNNAITNFKEIFQHSTNQKLKIKLAIAIYFGFDLYYRLFHY